MNSSPFREPPLPRRRHPWVQPMIGQSAYRNIIYVKTKLALRHERRALRDLKHLCPEWISFFRSAQKVICWSDGFILSARTVECANDWRKPIRSALDQFENWAIVDDKANVAELMNQGPIGTFLRGSADWSPTKGFAQVFVRFSEKDRDWDRTSDWLRGRFRAQCIPVFHFADGKIFFVKSNEPSRTILRRFERAAGKFEFLAGVDAQGDRWALQSKLTLQTFDRSAFSGTTKSEE